MPIDTLTRRGFLFSATLAALPALPALALARTSNVAPALLLAQDAPANVDPAGFLVSEKFDGVRALWDGNRLRFRSGLPVPAPAWFTARLPPVPLDGELWFGRGRFEALMGAVRRLSADDAEWRELRFMVFELPGAAGGFSARAAHIAALARRTNWPQLVAVEQIAVASRLQLQHRFEAVVRGGGEGLMLHRADAPYETGRSRSLLKLKPLHDAEATVVSHQAGRGKHAGRMGALRVRTDEGVEFLIGTGFSDVQRESPPQIGAIVTFTHRGSTEAGVPRFASFLRVHGGS